MDRWGFTVNTDKTVCMIFKKKSKRNYQDSEIWMQGKKIKRVTHTCFLGMALDEKLNWKKHIDQVVEQGKRALNLLRVIKGCAWGAHTKTMLTFYKAFIRGKIEYRSIIYDAAKQYEKKKRLDVIQNTAMRIILGTDRMTPSAAMEVALGLPPIGLRRRQLICGYWLQASQDENHPAYHAFASNINKYGGLPIAEIQRPSGWVAAGEIEHAAELNRTWKKMKIHKPTRPL